MISIQTDERLSPREASSTGSRCKALLDVEEKEFSQLVPKDTVDGVQVLAVIEGATMPNTCKRMILEVGEVFATNEIQKTRKAVCSKCAKMCHLQHKAFGEKCLPKSDQSVFLQRYVPHEGRN